MAPEGGGSARYHSPDTDPDTDPDGTAAETAMGLRYSPDGTGDGTALQPRWDCDTAPMGLRFRPGSHRAHSLSPLENISADRDKAYNFPMGHSLGWHARADQ